MYKKLTKIFVGKSLLKFFLIGFCIFLSLTGFIVSDNLVTNINNLIGGEVKPSFGGDIKIAPRDRLSQEQLNYLKNLEQENDIILSTKIQVYSTLADRTSEPSLVSLEFVDNNYPLYGELLVDKTGTSGGVYLTENLSKNFLVNNKIEIFGTDFENSGVIISDPQSSINLFDEGKKVILPLDKFDELNISDLGSRIDYDYYIKVNNENDFENILNVIKESPILEGIRIRDYTSGGDRFERVLSELNDYINYILIISFIITILIIFLSVESFYISNKRNFSVLKILGLKDKSIIIFNISLFFILLIICVIASYLISEVIFNFIRNYELSSTFSIYYDSIFKAFILGFIILFISIFLPLIKFFSNNPLAGLKENFLQVYSKKEILVQLSVVFVGVILIYNLIIGGIINSFVFTIGLFISIYVVGFIFRYILNYLFKGINSSSKLLSMGKVDKYRIFGKIDFSIFDSIRNSIKPGNLSILISFAYIISFSSILFISILSLNFFDKLNVNLNNENNIFVINLKDEDITKIDEKYKQNSYSMMLGRINEINGKTLKEHFGTENVSGRFSREFNITDTDLKDVEIVKGDVIKPGEVSVDAEFADSLNVKLGDEIEFLVYGLKKKLKVTNFRNAERGELEPFFYFQFFNGDFDNFPKTHFLSTYLDPELISDFKKDVLSKSGNYISFVDVGQIITEVKSISEKVFLVIQILFIYIFIFCLIALFVSILFLVPFKLKKSKLYNILGASRNFIKINNSFEYYYIQTIALILSIIIGSTGSYIILNNSDFINFEINVYFISLLFLIAVYLILLIILKVVFSKILK